MFQWNLTIDERLLDDEINCEETEGSAFTMPAMDEDGAVLTLSLLDEADNRVDDILVDDVLDIVLCPVEGEEAHAFDGGVVVGLSACAVDDVRDLVESKPLNILFIFVHTCAIISSPRNMLSVILVGIDIYSCV